MLSASIGSRSAQSASSPQPCKSPRAEWRTLSQQAPLKEIHAPTPEELTLELGIATLERLKEEASVAGTLPIDPYWYRAQYVLAVHAANLQLAQLEEGGLAETPSDNAVVLTTDLVVNILRTIDSDTRMLAKATFRSFIEDIHAPSMAMWAGTLR